jgi:endonuclease/exonuclease/phosphatase family metal-dependent hydrolase
VSAHLGERRAALAVEGTWAGRRWLFANTHLHSGAAKLGHDLRRKQEVAKLLEWLAPKLEKVDAAVLCGDFNADGGHAEIQALVDEGFRDIEPPLGGPLLTWQPKKNAVCAESVALNRDPNALAWDEVDHQFDHVFVWSKKPASWTSRIQLALDAPVGPVWLSDHFGLVADLLWTE